MHRPWEGFWLCWLEFYDKVLKAFGFGQIMCQWIYTFYNNIKSKVIANGHTSPPPPPPLFFFLFFFSSSFFLLIQRGCRQGDPISFFLFLLCVEILDIRIRVNRWLKGLILMTTNIRLRILLMILRWRESNLKKKLIIPQGAIFVCVVMAGS